MDTAAGKHPPTPHGHGLQRFLMTVMSEIMKMSMMESTIMMMIELVCFDNHLADVNVDKANYES